MNNLDFWRLESFLLTMTAAVCIITWCLGR